MSLKLGKSFNRQYNVRVPILDGYYNLKIYFDRKSTFLLFGVEPDFSSDSTFKHNVKVNMFKNLESSKFCEVFIDLHNYRKSSLDIVNQFDKINDYYTDDISFVINESIVLSKIVVDEKELYDTLNIYGFTMNPCREEFIFLITERHNIIKKLNKKIVRTSGIQLATTPSIEYLNDYHEEKTTEWNAGKEVKGDPNKILKID